MIEKPCLLCRERLTSNGSIETEDIPAGLLYVGSVYDLAKGKRRVFKGYLCEGHLKFLKADGANLSLYTPAKKIKVVIKQFQAVLPKEDGRIPVITMNPARVDGSATNAMNQAVRYETIEKENLVKKIYQPGDTHPFAETLELHLEALGYHDNDVYFEQEDADGMIFDINTGTMYDTDGLYMMDSVIDHWIQNSPYLDYAQKTLAYPNGDGGMFVKIRVAPDYWKPDGPAPEPEIEGMWGDADGRRIIERITADKPELGKNIVGFYWEEREFYLLFANTPRTLKHAGHALMNLPYVVALDRVETREDELEYCLTFSEEFYEQIAQGDAPLPMFKVGDRREIYEGATFKGWLQLPKKTLVQFIEFDHRHNGDIRDDKTAVMSVQIFGGDSRAYATLPVDSDAGREIIQHLDFMKEDGHGKHWYAWSNNYGTNELATPCITRLLPEIKVHGFWEVVSTVMVDGELDSLTLEMVHETRTSGGLLSIHGRDEVIKLLANSVHSS